MARRDGFNLRSLLQMWQSREKSGNTARYAMAPWHGYARGLLFSQSALVDPEKLDIKDQLRVRGDDARRAPCAVTEISRDDQAALATDLHPCHTEVPPLDNIALAQAKDERLAPINRTIESYYWHSSPFY